MRLRTSCDVDDVDAHCQAARQRGAVVVSEPADQPWGDRTWTGRDEEGFLWTFRKKVQDVSLDELHARLSNQGQ